jgi:hypothetical protein
MTATLRPTNISLMRQAQPVSPAGRAQPMTGRPRACRGLLPGHEGIHGNECADTLAKKAANSLTPNTAEELTLMASARRTLRIEAAGVWKTEWATSTHGNSLRRLWKAPSKAPMQLYQGLRKAATSVLIQMQTGKIALASYLSTFKAMESTECACGHTPCSPPEYQPRRATDAPSYTGVKAGAGLPGLPNSARLSTESGAVHT